MEALLAKAAFKGLEPCTWFYSGAETPPLLGGIEAVNQYMNNRTKGPEGRDANTVVEMACKANVARLLNGQAEDIAFLSNSSEIISMIALSLQLKPGDNIVIHTLEFPSGVLPWLLLKQQGIEVRVVDHEKWTVSVNALLDRVDARTKLVVTSHVSYLSGARIDYAELYRKLEKTETLLLLDATQSLGAVAVDMNDADFVVCSSYKWLLGIHGVGILAANPKRTKHIYPNHIGWRGVSDMFGPNRFEAVTFHEDARKFETGFPSYSALYALNYSTELLLSIGIEHIESHILQLGGELIQQLKQLGYEVMTPEAPDQRAGNICIVAEHGETIAKHLSANNVYVWGGDGRLRASIHLFNDSEDVDKLISLLKQL